MKDDTRQLMKLLNLTPDEIYHVFCLTLCMADADGVITDQEGEMLTRIGFALGLMPQDISALANNAKDAIEETSRTDVVSHSLTALKERLNKEQLSGVKQIIAFIAGADKHIDNSEQSMLQMMNEVWA